MKTSQLSNFSFYSPYFLVPHFKLFLNSLQIPIFLLKLKLCETYNRYLLFNLLPKFFEVFLSYLPLICLQYYVREIIVIYHTLNSSYFSVETSGRQKRTRKKWKKKKNPLENSNLK